jgi:hypothetical protein
MVEIVELEITRQRQIARQFASFGLHLTPKVNFLTPSVYPIEKGLVLGYERRF